MITLSSQAYTGLQKFPSLPWNITDACPDAMQMGTTDESRISTHILASNRCPFQQVTECCPSPLVRAATGIQLSGDGLTPGS